MEMWMEVEVSGGSEVEAFVSVGGGGDGGVEWQWFRAKESHTVLA